ncbi:hypothetical protein M422DRAFT_64026 [Sphaerobolus stellatus SS14]|nr:hypothetical protein M422DRAFT_64026 [Sphaerobolus stellatus SS14]
MLLRTLVSPSSSAILHHLSHLKNINPQESTLLFTLSCNASNVEAIITHLRQTARHTLGCLSAPFPGKRSSNIVCSIAYLRSQDCIPFRSEIPGRDPIQVGRWHTRAAPIKPSNLPDFSQKASSWAAFEGTGKAHELPEELRGRSDFNSVLYFSDNAPEGLIRSLSQPDFSPKQFGLIASSTPFITGHPYTLFYGDNVCASGAVGVALKTPTAEPTIAYHGLVPLSSPMRVTKSEGNLIYELDHSNPAQLLIDAIAKSDNQIRQKDESFFMADLAAEAPYIGKVYRIMAGGPSRGTLALEGEDAPEAGRTVQFFLQNPEGPKLALDSMPSAPAQPENAFTFLCSPDAHEITPRENAEEETDCEVIDGSFVTASENGFICSKWNSNSKYTIPGSLATLSL